MTDTPRTQTELLNIFADAQGPAQITPQDIRDLVESVAEPIVGGGIGWNPAKILSYYGAETTPVWNGGSHNDLVASELLFRSDADVMWDPEGWVNPNPFSGAHGDLAARQSLLLPPGLYLLDGQWGISQAIASGKSIGFTASAELTDYSGVPRPYGSPDFNAPGASNAQSDPDHWHPQLVNIHRLLVQPFPFATPFSFNLETNDPASINLTNVWLNVHRLL